MGSKAVQLRRTDGGNVDRLSMIGAAGRADDYDCTLWVCPDPTCGCREIRVSLIPERSDGLRSGEELDRMEFELDVFARTIGPGRDDLPSIQGRALGLDVAAALSDEQWTMLHSFFMEQKRLAVEGCEPDEIRFSFNFEEIEASGLLVDYHEVFPLAPELVAEVDGQEYFVRTLYCVLTHCPCIDAVLDVAPRIAVSEVNPRWSLGAMTVDYRANNWASGPEDPLSAELGAGLRRSLMERYPEFLSILERRHSILKRVYRNSVQDIVRAVGGNAPAKRTKTGRNAPCPCGSGLKYKRCCGR